ncbi:MAG TPA: ABC transporter permease subunit, partial [Anaerolineales bacterium]|nr:ABC transporter permease subunit [Anaerolineales bacterium]
DPALEEAARDLGAGPLDAFRLVTLPIIAPAVIAAGIFAFSWSFDAFVVTHFVIGSQVTFPIWVWSALRYPKNLPIINAVSSLIVVAEMALIYLGERFRQKGGEEGAIF